MKKLSLFITLLIFSAFLEARDNPFEPTKAYQDEVARMMEIEETYPDEFQQKEQAYIEQIQEQIKKNSANSINKDTKQMPVKKAKIDKTDKELSKIKKEMKLTEEKIKKLIKEAQKQTVKETKQIVSKAVEKQKDEIIYVKPRTDVSYEKELLTFLSIEYTNEKFQIKTKYDLFKKFTLPNKNKIILDFHAKESFYTKREDIKSNFFNKITVGNHKKEKFFRVVLDLSEAPQNYEVTYEDNIVTIYKLEQI